MTYLLTYLSADSGRLPIEKSLNDIRKQVGPAESSVVLPIHSVRILGRWGGVKTSTKTLSTPSSPHWRLLILYYADGIKL